MAVFLNEMVKLIDRQEATVWHGWTSVMPTIHRQLSIWRHQIFDGLSIKRNADVN